MKRIALFFIAIMIVCGVYAQRSCYLFNTYYDRPLGGGASEDGPALSDWTVKGDSSAYIFAIEPAGEGYEEYVYLRHLASGKYLQASNAWHSWGMDTWSMVCWG